MGFFRKLLSVAAPIVGTAFGPVGTAIGAGIGGMLSKNEQAHEQQQAGAQAGQIAQGGYNYLQNSPVGQTYVPGGAAAATAEQAALGIGGDPAAAAAGYHNYLNSIGYQSQLHAGQQAITTSAAAHGLFGSGSTAKALMKYGTDLGAQKFDNYLAHLHGIAGQGLQAAGMVGNAAQAGSADAARYAFNANTGAAETHASGWDQLLGGLGQAYDAWKAGRAKMAYNTTPALAGFTAG